MTMHCDYCKESYDHDLPHKCRVGKESAEDRIRRETATALLAGMVDEGASSGHDDRASYLIRRVNDALRGADMLLLALKRGS